MSESRDAKEDHNTQSLGDIFGRARVGTGLDEAQFHRIAERLFANTVLCMAAQPLQPVRSDRLIL